jgi:hypothetical protein
MIPFNGNLAKAFPERVALVRENLAKHAAALRGLDPIPIPEPDALSKLVRHVFEEGHRVRVHAPGHHAHGHVGVVKDARTDRLEVKLDSGHTIHCRKSDLIPEDFSAARSAASAKISKMAGYDPIPLGDESTDVLAKRARSEFRVGQTVVEKGLQGRRGVVVSTTPSGLIEFQIGPGVRCVCSPDSLEAA